jgi:hypothetical protein
MGHACFRPQPLPVMCPPLSEEAAAPRDQRCKNIMIAPLAEVRHAVDDRAVEMGSPILRSA